MSPPPSRDPPSTDYLQGPNQILFKTSPCASYKQSIPEYSITNIICDTCNQNFHFSCVNLTTLPPLTTIVPFIIAISLVVVSMSPQKVSLSKSFFWGPAPTLTSSSFSLPYLSPTAFTMALCNTGRGRLPFSWCSSPLSRTYHLQYCHFGATNLYHLISQNFYWTKNLSPSTSFLPCVSRIN